jgi:TonB family protein
MQKKALLTSTLLVSSLLTSATPSGQGLNAILTEQYNGKTLFFRHFFQSDSQEYDSDGQAIKNSPQGPWALYGQMLVKKITLDKDKLQLEGNRVVYRFDEQAVHLTPLRNHEKVKVTIRLSSPLTTVEEAAAVLGKVFAVTEEERVNLVPAEWRHYLVDHPTALGGPSEAKRNDVQNPTTEKVFHAGESGVTPPKVVSRWEPIFPPAARNEALQGTVGLRAIVDSAGRVREIKVVHPVGKGLDESAIEAVKNWRFKPATKDGVAVPVEVYIEVDFHLN